MFKHILVPSDGSEFSQSAVRRAVTFAREAGARITAFYAKPLPAPARYVDGIEIGRQWNQDDLAEEQAQEVLDFVEKLCQEAGVQCSKLCVSSNLIYEAIIEAARDCDCDLIFMASHGRRGLSALILGSETHKVLTHSKIPVLVYR